MQKFNNNNNNKEKRMKKMRRLDLNLQQQGFQISFFIYVIESDSVSQIEKNNICLTCLFICCTVILYNL